MSDNKQPIEYYVAEAKRLGLTEEQQSVIGDETDGDAFREHIANAHDKSDDELREILAQEWDDYSADPKPAATSFNLNAEAEDEADGRHADSVDEDWEDEDLDEVDEDEPEEDHDSGDEDGIYDGGQEPEWDEEEDEDDAGFDDSATDDGAEISEEPEEDDKKSDRGRIEHATTVDTAAFDSDSLDHLDIDEDAIEQKRNGGGEAIDGDEADCEGCKI